MKYIHYWHFANRWYMHINDTPDHARIPSGNEACDSEYAWKEEYFIADSVGLTHRQIKEKLAVQYPDHVLIKEIAYHEGARWRGFKGGSREGAVNTHKRPIKERRFVKQLQAAE